MWLRPVAIKLVAVRGDKVMTTTSLDICQAEPPDTRAHVVAGLHGGWSAEKAVVYSAWGKMS